MTVAFYVIKKIKLLDCGFDTDALASGSAIIHPTDPLYNFLMTTIRKNMFGIPRGDKDISAVCARNEFALLEMGLSLINPGEVVPSIPQRTEPFVTHANYAFDDAQRCIKRKIIKPVQGNLFTNELDKIVLSQPSVKFVVRADNVMNVQLHYAHEVVKDTAIV